MEIILASGSPRRRELLDRIGLPFRMVKPDFDENTLGKDMAPAPLVEALSRGKAAAAAAAVGSPDALILAADTVVVLDGAVLGKPADEADAFRMLTALSGTGHQVYTGVTVRRGDRILTGHEVTSVTFRPLTGEEIRAYIATGEPMDKAGAYGVQGLGALLVERIEGDFFNVMGLPMCRLGRMLRQFDLDCLAPKL